VFGMRVERYERGNASKLSQIADYTGGFILANVLRYLN
jgi:hypothetical protein